MPTITVIRHVPGNNEPICWCWDLLTGMGYRDDTPLVVSIEEIFRDIICVPLRAKLYEPALLARTGPVMYYDAFD